MHLTGEVDVYPELNIVAPTEWDVTNALVSENLNQWQLHEMDDFDGEVEYADYTFLDEDAPSPAPGWSRHEKTRCQGSVMLGGYCEFANTTTGKTYEGLPEHSEIRVKANVNFFDRW